MTSSEFREWLELHQTLFPAVGVWLQGQSDKSLLLDEWAAVLRNVSFASCKAATRAILSGQCETKGHQGIPAAVRAWASELDAESRQQAKREPSHNPLLCELCGNTGAVSIWHPLLVRAVREGCKEFKSKITGAVHKVFDINGRPRYPEVAVACKCPKGDRLATDRKVGVKTFKAMVVYGSQSYHVPMMTNDWEADIARHVPDNFVQEFADF